MSPEQQLAISLFRERAAMTATALKVKLDAGVQLDVHEALWLEKAASKFPGATTPVLMCEALINRQALALVTKRLKT